MRALAYLWKLSIQYFIFLNINIDCSHREKRTLVFPGPAKVQLIYGIGLPIALEDVSVVRGYVVKANYLLPIDAWNYTNPETIITRKTRDVQTRWNLYNVLSNFLSRFGGKSCILRTICEYTEYEFNKNDGFFEEIFHTIFKPSSTADKLLNTMDKEFMVAENFGRSNRGLCGIIYSECTISLLELLMI